MTEQHQDQISAARKQAAQFHDIGFRRACRLVKERLKQCAAQLRQLGQNAYDEGYPERKLAWMEASSRVLTEARVVGDLEVKKLAPDTQSSFKLEAAE